MTLVETTVEALGRWPSPTLGKDFVTVPTHCIYPSNGIVHVYVSGGNSEFKVHDGSGALDELEAGGGNTYDDIYILRNIAKEHGLHATSTGTIHSPMVSAEQLAGTIALVANASKEAAHALIARYRAIPKRNFREMLAQMVDTERSQGRFLEVSFRRMIVGASSKSHKFDYDIILPSQKRLLLDSVVPEASSINSVVAANLDVRQAELADTIQRIVYDDTDDWRAEDLNLLGLGATVIPFSKLRPVLDRIAA
jgi:hypothetical protein